MPDTTVNSRIVSFGWFQIDLRAEELYKNGVKVRLQKQSFQILAVLLERPGELVTREEIRARLWPADTFVDFDHSVNAAIKRLREALGDVAESPRFIETLPRRGYRFIAPVNGLLERRLSVQSLSRSPKWQGLLLAGLGLLVLAGAIHWRLSRPRGAEWATSARRLTTNPSENPIGTALLSPDGQSLLYSDEHGIWLRAIGTGEVHQIALPKGFTAKPKAWLPDSTHLVVMRTAEPERPSIWRVSIFGDNPREIATHATEAAVSRDGQRIATTRGEQDDREIWVSDVDGFSESKVFEVPVGEWLGPASWSPDGRYLAFVHRTLQPDVDVQTRLEIFELSSGKVIAGEVGPFATSICWLPDGYIIHARQRHWPDRFELWALPMREVQANTRQPHQIAAASGNLTGLSTSADGTRLVYVNALGQGDVSIGSLVDGGNRLEGLRRLTSEDSNDRPFSWTADSKEIIFTSDRNGTEDIFQQSIDASLAEPLVVTPELASLDWSADSKSLFAYSIPEGGETTLLRIELDGTTHELWKQSKTPGGWAVPSPDGQYVALETFTRDQNAWILEMP
jgi:DNA-binding winged helix-turn-helix (wHTH) protein/Tol biopolymer transport system component